MNVDLLVPWRAGCPHRLAAFSWMLGKLFDAKTGWRLNVARSWVDPWCKAQALAPYLADSYADIVIIHDADVWCDETPRAVQAVADGAAWAIPHLMVHRLTGAATGRLIAGDPTGEVEQAPYKGVKSGGIVVLQRHVALDVPMDSRFQGWGGEDHSWGWALTTLVGDPWRGSADLIHLWHPPADRLNRRVGSYPSEQLRRRYFTAQNNRPRMRALVEEGRGSWPTGSRSTGQASARS